MVGSIIYRYMIHNIIGIQSTYSHLQLISEEFKAQRGLLFTGLLFIGNYEASIVFMFIFLCWVILNNENL